MNTVELNGGPDRCLYTVLTFDRKAYLRKKAGRSRDTAYEDVKHLFGAFVKRLRRRFGEVEYIATIEQHLSSGWPHVNVLFVSRSMREWFDATSKSAMRDLLRFHASSVGFGYILTKIEPPRSLHDVAGYLVKTGDRSTRVAGEMAKGTQMPVNAPPHTRRLRFSGGLVRPKEESSERTGTLVAAPLDLVEAHVQWSKDELERSRIARLLSSTGGRMAG